MDRGTCSTAQLRAQDHHGRITLNRPRSSCGYGGGKLGCRPKRLRHRDAGVELRPRCHPIRPAERVKRPRHCEPALAGPTPPRRPAPPADPPAAPAHAERGSANAGTAALLPPPARRGLRTTPHSCRNPHPHGAAKPRTGGMLRQSIMSSARDLRACRPVGHPHGANPTATGNAGDFRASRPSVEHCSDRTATGERLQGQNETHTVS
jgi:hypothetical protein